MAKKKKDDSKLKKLLATLIKRIEKHGPRSNEVKKFVQKNTDVDEFLELAATTIVVYEKAGKGSRKTLNG